MLKLHFKDNRQIAFLVTEKLYCIGSAADNQLVINDDSIDPTHAKLFVDDNKYVLKDNNSSSGCFINGQRITQKEILPGDIIRLGNTELIVLDPRRLPDQEEDLGAPWRLVSDSSWLPGKIFIIPPDRPMIIGRTDKCDITIPGTHLSRRHAELRLHEAQLIVKDLGSANGTFLNDKLITEAVAHNGDRLRLDVYTFRVVAPEIENKTRIRQPLDTISKPIERKQPSNEPKRWKTRPTSPGNRSEPTYEEGRSTSALRWLPLVIAVIAIGLIASKFL